MAELNFGLLTPPGSENIGNAFLRGQDQARAAQMQDMQMQQSMRQGQREELQYKKMQTEEDNLNKFYSNVAENGGPKDPVAIEDAMMKSGVPNVADAGLAARMARLRIEQSRVQDREAMGLPSAGVAVSPVAPTAPASPLLPSFGGGNQLAAAAGALPVAAPTNAMIQPDKQAAINAAKQKMLSANPGVRDAGKMELEQLTKPGVQHVVGDKLIGADGRVIYEGAFKPAPPPSMVAEYTFAKTPDGGGFRGSFQDFVKERAAAVRPPRPEAAPRTQQVQMLDGTLGIMNMDTGAITAGTMGGEPVKGKSAATAEKPLTESQGNATAYGLRMKEAESILEDLAKQGVLRGAMVEAVPFVGGATGKALPSAFGGTSQQQQQVNQAKSNFITAVLRKESGAVISDSEFAREDEKYFPQVNDGPGVIKQKANARRLAIEAMKFQAGPGAKEIDKYVPNAATGKTSATLSEPPPGAVRPRGRN